MPDYAALNRTHWNRLTGLHEKSAFYNVKGFKAGKSTLKSIELEELGDVSGKSLLHLLCHFGLDTLSWARCGAQVTGVDLSNQAISLAQSLSRELAIPARFICANVYDLPDLLPEQFDIVFASYGVLHWLPDLPRWMQIVASFLKPGGVFYLVEFHRFPVVLDGGPEVTDLHVDDRYFFSPEPLRQVTRGSYTDGQSEEETEYLVWYHHFGEILTSLVQAGLRLEFFHEFPVFPRQRFDCMVQGEDGWWRLKDHQESLPLLFSLKATK